MSTQTVEDKHLEDSLAGIRSIFEKVAVRIADLKPGEKVPATDLAASIAKEIGMTGPQLYPTLKFILNDKYPGVEIRKGAHGGVYKLDPNKPVRQLVPASALPKETIPDADIKAAVASVMTTDDADTAEDIAAEKEVQPIVNS